MMTEIAIKKTVKMNTTVHTRLSRVWDTVSRLKTLVVVVGLLYAASIGAGIVTWRLMPTA